MLDKLDKELSFVEVHVHIQYNNTRDLLCHEQGSNLWDLKDKPHTEQAVKKELVQQHPPHHLRVK